MPRGSELSEGEREQIRAMHTAGISNRRIAEQLCRSSRTIDRFVQDPEAYSKRKRCVMPKELSLQDERRTGRLVSKAMVSNIQLRATLSTPVSRVTVWRSIKRNNNIVVFSILLAAKITRPHGFICWKEDGDESAKGMQKIFNTPRDAF